MADPIPAVTPPAAPVTPVEPVVVQKQVSQTPSLPSASECVAQLKVISDRWTSNFSGRVNHNPHLKVAQLIKPLLDQLATGAAVTPEMVAKIDALPTEPPVLNPNWTPEQTPSAILMPSAKTVGALNIK
jgi:hypothetical protein